MWAGSRFISLCPDCGLVFCCWWFCVVWAVACSYIYRGGAVRFVFFFVFCCLGCCPPLLFGGGAVRFFYSLGPWARVFFGCGVFAFGNKFLLIQKKKKNDVTEAVESFFDSGCMLQEINCTIIALVPKVPNPESMHDYRPISCCNTIYKCISKIIASRIKMCLPDIINPSQSAFVHGRSIADNVLITQDLMHNYHRNNGRPRCALKIDIKKAYDTIGWSCVIDILSRLGTPANILKCIKACITTPSFSVVINGELAGSFSSKRGLRQGDPLSPLLFIIAMEAVSMSLYVAAQAPNFEFHPKCEGIKLTHVSFADDIFLFAGGTTSSVRVIMDELNKFENFSGLQVNKQKSAIFLAGISDAIRNEMLNITGFSLGRLPMKYLGVPLLSTRLSHNDCQPLIDKIMVRIQAWTSRSLSFAGRLQLLSSVLYNIQMYWCSMFIIPKYTIAKKKFFG